LTFAEEMLKHAVELLYDPAKQPGDIQLRRAVSALYYALFHDINASAARLVAPNVSLQTNHRIQRWFEHAEMKKVCWRFVPPKLDQPLLSLIGETASPDLRNVARTFIKLQDARHSADYDLGYNLTFEDAGQLLAETAIAMGAWNSIQNSAEANIFILSLLMWKNWDKER